MKKVYLILTLFLLLMSLTFVGCDETSPSLSPSPSVLATPTLTPSQSIEPSQSPEPPVDTSRYVIVCDQKNKAVTVYDLNKPFLPENAVKTFEQGFFESIADARLRIYKDKKVIVTACGNGIAGLFDYETGNYIYMTDRAANNPHAAELSPSGTLAVASSTGNEVRFFDVSSGSRSFGSVYLTDAHAVTYDEDRDGFWLLGSNQLLFCRVSKRGSRVFAEVDDSLSATVPGVWGHDMSPVYGQTDVVWLAMDDCVLQYDRTSGEFLDAFAGSDVISRKEVKGVCTLGSGETVFVYPDREYYYWTTGTLCVWSEDNGLTQLSCSDVGMYKVRAFTTDYQ